MGYSKVLAGAAAAIAFAGIGAVQAQDYYSAFIGLPVIREGA